MPLPRNPNKAAKDAYFTPVETCEWCLSKLSEIVDLSGLKVLEPAAGSGNFVKAGSFGLNWTSNEPYPEYSQGFEADFSGDFTDNKWRATLGTFDAVISNPPFGDTASRLAKKFVNLSLELAPLVAMVLPKGCRRGRFQDQLPKDVKIVQDLDLDCEFILPDGTTKKVGCCWMVFQRVEGYSRPQILEYEPYGYRCLNGVADPPSWATHGIGLVHNANKLYDVNDPEFKRGSLATLWLELSTEEQKKALYSIDLKPLIVRTQTSFPRVTWHEAMTYLNKAIREVANS